MFNCKNKRLLAATFFLLLVIPIAGKSESTTQGAGISTNEECAAAADINVFHGTLDAISLKASMLQLTTGRGTKVITFDDNTVLIGTETFSSIEPESDLKIECIKEDEKLLAVSIQVAIKETILESNQIDAKTLSKLISAKTTPFTLVDVRTDESYSQGHIPGSVSIYNGVFTENIDKLPANKKQLIVYYCDGTDWKLSASSARRAEEVGYTNVKVLSGGFPAWQKAGFRTSTRSTPEKIAYISIPLKGVVDTKEFIRAAIARNTDTILLDVRSDQEVIEGVIAGAVAIPADEIMDRLAEIPNGKQILIYCATGVRAAMVYSLLKDKGFTAKFLDKIVTVRNDGSFTIEDHNQNL